MTNFDFNTPDGHRILAAGDAVLDPHSRGITALILQAALAVAMDDTCPTCGGKGYGESPLMGYLCDGNCIDGKVTPPIYALLGIETADDGWRQVIQLLRHDDHIYSQNIASSLEAHLKERIERRERER